MCLVSYVVGINGQRLIATEDMVVYKVLARNTDYDSIFYESPYFPHFAWKIGKTYHSALEIDTSQGSIYTHTNAGLHSYYKKKLILNIMRYGTRLSADDCRLFKAIIPEGAEYIQNAHGEIASTQLKLIKKLKIVRLLGFAFTIPNPF